MLHKKPNNPFVLGINGSPNKKGHVAKMLQRVLREAEKQGGKTRLIHLVEYRIFPHTGKLNQKIYIEPTKDDMPELQKLVLEADGIIFATPTHWFNVSSVMKLFLDRLTSLEHYDFLLEGKVGGIITYGPEGGALNSAMMLMMIINQMGMVLPPYAAQFDEGRGDEWLKRDCELLGKNMMQQIKAGGILKLNWGYPEATFETSPIELLKKKKLNKR